MLFNILKHREYHTMISFYMTTMVGVTKNLLIVLPTFMCESGRIFTQPNWITVGENTNSLLMLDIIPTSYFMTFIGCGHWLISGSRFMSYLLIPGNITMCLSVLGTSFSGAVLVIHYTHWYILCIVNDYTSNLIQYGPPPHPIGYLYGP